MASQTMSASRGQRRTFYMWLAAACALVAFGGFAPTYWLQLPAGTFVGKPLLHFHALLFSAWPLFLLSQAILVATGRIANHRAWGMAGISLATALVLVGLATAIGSMMTGIAAGYGDRSRSFLILPVGSILMFAGFMVAAIANIKRPEWHKRFILVASIALLQAAVARVFFLLATGGGPGVRPGLSAPPPVSIGLAGGLVADLLIVAGMIYDWRTRGRPHPAWLVGLGVMLAVQLLRGPFSTTGAWLSFARFLEMFG